MDAHFNLRKLLGERTLNLTILEQFTLTALLHPKQQLRAENIEYLSEFRIHPEKPRGRWTISQEGPDFLAYGYSIKSAFVEDNKVFLLLEHPEGMRYFGYLCDLPKTYIDKLNWKDIKPIRIFGD